jgi:hypothetical protein
MINEIIKKINIELAALNFADLLGGIVKPITQNVKDRENNVTQKVYPVYMNENKGTCSVGDYLAMTPDSSKMSVMYWEDQGGTNTVDNVRSWNMVYNVRLVAWFNLKRINSALHDSDILIPIICNAIPERVENFVPYTKIQVMLTGQETKSPAIFGAYTYDEAEKQYLIYPFDYFALNFRITFDIPKSCVQDITINPATC